MRRVFISYRRADAEYAAGALGRELRRHFGDEQIFRDKENVGGGVAWKRQVLHEIDKDSALLVLIGPEWVNIKDAQGRRRLDDSDDAVRLEIADGIRDGAAILPVLLENAQMPNESELPSDLRPLADFNAMKLRDGDWAHDLANILRTLEKSGFKPVGTPLAMASEAQRAAPVAMKGFGAKIILCAIFTLWGFAGLIIGDLSRDGYLDVIIVSIVGLILGLLSWRETRHENSAIRTFSIVLSVLASVGLLIAIGGL
jgi:hypothetical protein